MPKTTIPQDDLLDVQEMTRKMERYISRILNENEPRLGLSALMSAAINCIVNQCDSIDELIFYRNAFMKIFNSTVRIIEATQQE